MANDIKLQVGLKFRFDYTPKSVDYLMITELDDKYVTYETFYNNGMHPFTSGPRADLERCFETHNAEVLNQIKVTMFDGKEIMALTPCYALQAHNGGKWIILEIHPFTEKGKADAEKGYDKYPYCEMQIEVFR